MASSGFWSYVHADDAAEKGRIKDLARDLAEQFQAITTEPIEIFFDKSSLDWGDDWEVKIEEAVVSTSFFIPVLSPRYLASEACRRELRLFVRTAVAIGYTDLVLPLVWFDVPELHEAHPTDDLVAIIKRYQWEDWRELRFEERVSGAYRRAVARLAQRLVDRSAGSIARTPVVSNPLPTAVPEHPAAGTVKAASSEDGEGGDLGTLDLMAQAERALPEWSATMEAVRSEIEVVGALAREATAEMTRGEKHGKGFAARLTAARSFALALDPHAERIEELGNEFTTHLYDVDGGIRAMLTLAATVDDPGEREGAAQLQRSVREMAESSREGLGAMSSMVNSIAPLEATSRDLRVPLRKMRKGLTVMVEGQRVIDEWERLAGGGAEGDATA